MTSRRPNLSKVCAIQDCGRPFYAKGWCRRHHARWVRHGDPTTLLAKPYTRGEAAEYLNAVVLKHDIDECLFWPFARDSNGYGCLTGNRRVHVVVCEHRHGPPPTPLHEAAHECGMGHEGCCAQLHLTWKTHAENMADMARHGPRATRRAA